MKTKLSLFIVFVLVAMLLPVTSASAAATYAVGISYVTDGTVQNPTGALGAPDGVYASLTSAVSIIVLDMGTDVQGIITVYHSSRSPSCEVLGLGSEMISLGYTTAGATFSVFAVPAGVVLPPYTAVRCNTLPKKSSFSLDAVKLGSDYAPPFAVGVFGYSSTIQNPTAALGEPDGVYAIMTGTGSSIVLDMGTPVQGIITVYHSSKSPSCEVLGVGSEMMSLGYTTAGATFSVFTVPAGVVLPPATAVRCNTLPKKSAFSLDAVKMEPPIP